MTTNEKHLALLRSFNQQLRVQDPDLAEEILDTSKQKEVLEVHGPVAAIQAEADEESIVLRRTRPVLDIKHDQVVVAFRDDEDVAIWKARIDGARALLEPAIRAVGRIELQGHPQFAWIGTGWLVDADVMVTNRHVAAEFARGDTLVFKAGTDGPMTADIDFLREFGSTQTRVFEVTKVLHVEPTGGPDLAFFTVEQLAGSDRLAAPIPLASEAAPGSHVAVIGYPAQDGRIPEQELMEEIYGKRYERKRLAPGALTEVDETRILHDCTTLGGNSGSVVLDLGTGEAVGLHFSGSFLKTNYAVRADIVRRRLDEVRSGLARGRSVPSRPRPRSPELRASASAGSVRSSGESATLTIPLVITVSLGGALNRAAPSPRRPAARPTADRADDVETEAPVADYADRGGYVPGFLGKKLTIDLPKVVKNAGDVLAFKIDGQRETELRYEHFSVKMSKSRRMCIFSAVNIDGQLSKKSTRTGWRRDPRIPKEMQILNECYGDPPRFSRGHMTRREDPAWGTPKVAKRGNQDSMHVTNAVPQMQAFNSPIWLELEDYALQHAREDDMKISVFTGPYFDFDGVADPVIDGVRIPRSFWKVIAFAHDETHKLCATGYEMSQQDNLPTEEFVFGDFVSSHLNVSTQVSIARIEARAGLRFGDLANVDPMATEDEAVVGDEPLTAFGQIRFF